MSKITSKELKEFPSAVESLMVSHWSRFNPDAPVKWRSAGKDDSRSQVVNRSRKVKDGDFTVSKAVVAIALLDEQVSITLMCCQNLWRRYAC